MIEGACAPVLWATCVRARGGASLAIGRSARVRHARRCLTPTGVRVTRVGSTHTGRRRRRPRGQSRGKALSTYHTASGRETARDSRGGGAPRHIHLREDMNRSALVLSRSGLKSSPPFSQRAETTSGAPSSRPIVNLTAPLSPRLRRCRVSVENRRSCRAVPPETALSKDEEI